MMVYIIHGVATMTQQAFLMFFVFVGITIGFTQTRHRASEGTGGVPVTVQMLSGRLATTSTVRMYTVDGAATSK